MRRRAGGCVALAGLLVLASGAGAQDAGPIDAGEPALLSAHQGFDEAALSWWAPSEWWVRLFCADGGEIETLSIPPSTMSPPAAASVARTRIRMSPGLATVVDTWVHAALLVTSPIPTRVWTTAPSFRLGHSLFSVPSSGFVVNR